MPKKRKKNPGVGIDFKRAKLKVGKKLPQAKNATDTNFKAHSISLPGQGALTGDRSDVPVSDRNLTIKDLLSQVGHYSERVRKDALTGLFKLLSQHPEVLRSQAGTIVEKLAERAADTDEGVRAAVRDLLRDVVLPGLGAAGLAPFLPLLMAHITSAMTHLAAAVRADALLVLNMVMAAAPQHVTGTYLLPALQHYAHLLAPSQRARSVSAGSMKNLLEVVTGLQSLLQHADSAGSRSAPAADDNDAGATPEHRRKRRRTLYQDRCQPPARSLLAIYRMTPKELLASLGKAGGHQGVASEPLETAMHALLERLLEAWAECAPSQLSTSPELASAACCRAILICARRLLDRLPSGHAQRWRNATTRKIAPHVPVSAPAVQPSASVMAVLVDLNIAAAELLTRFLSSVTSRLPKASSATTHHSVPEQEGGWAGRLVEFYEGVLRSGEVLPPSGGLAQGMRQPSISADVYANILTGVGTALPALPLPRRTAVLDAVNSLAGRLSASSPVLALVLKFRLGLLAEPQHFYPAEGAELPFLDEQAAASWLEPLPRQLWELRGSHASTCELMLRMLHRAGVFAQAGSPISAALQRLQDQLMPCFLLVQLLQQSKKPKKGASDGRVKIVAGPLARLPTKCQELALDILYYIQELHESTLRTLVLLCLSPAYPPSLAQRAVSIVQHAAHAGRVAPDLYLSFLASLIVGRSSAAGEDLLDLSYARAEQVVSSASRAVASFPGSAAAALKHMAPVLKASLVDEDRSKRSMYGCIAALRDCCAALPSASGSSGDACTSSLPEELQDCLPGALLVYACGHAAVQDALARSAADSGMDGTHAADSAAHARVSDPEIARYPDSIVYDLLACQPALVEPFVQALTAYACSSSVSRTEGCEERIIINNSDIEKRVLYSLQIGQKMMQHEQLRAALLLGTVSPRSMVSALTEAAAAASALSGGALSAARQKLLSLQEIHFGAA